eukprot:m.32221 g.32221  ORF g.32221 m.32221 type:complete len:117 (+) comp31604_c0_seq7:13-363(+)
MSKREALHWYRRLLRTRMKVFKGDEEVLIGGKRKSTRNDNRKKFRLAAKKRIRDEFVKNKYETDSKRKSQLLKIAKETDGILRQNVIQGVLTKSDTYRFQLTDETVQTVDFGQTKH